MIELAFDVDNFNKPKTYENGDAKAIQLHHSLSAKQTTSLTQGLAFEIRRYRFNEIDGASSTIENDLRAHCMKYLPDIYIESLQVQVVNSNNLYILLTIVDDATKSDNTIVFSVSNKVTQLLVDLVN